MNPIYNLNVDKTYIWRMLGVPTALVIFCIFLFIFAKYLVFHIIAEFFSMLVGFTALTVSSTSYQFTKNRFVIFLAIALGWCSLLDFIHVIVYQGMNLISERPITESTQFWIAARFLQAMAFLTAPIFLYRRCSIIAIHGLLMVYTLTCSMLIFTGNFPITYVLQSGVTEFKFLAEMVIILILLISCAIYYKHRAIMAVNVYHALMASMIAMILSESMFSNYISLIGLENMTGHLLKIYCYWFIYVALVITTLREPFNQLTRTASNYDVIPDPTIIMNTTGIIYQANKAAGLFTQATPEKLVGLSCHNVFHNASISPNDCPVCQAIQRQSHEFLIEISRGENSWVECKLSPIDSPFYKNAWIQVIRDVSIRKELETSKATAFHDLAERVKELRCYSNISALSTRDDLTISVLLENAVQAIPAAFQYPELCHATITSDWGSYSAGNTPTHIINTLKKSIYCQGKLVATIEITYSSTTPDSPLEFLKEEETLMESIASMLSNIINRLLTTEKNQQITYLYEMLSAIDHAALRCHNNDELLAGLFEAMQKFAHLDTIIIAKASVGAPHYKIIHSMGIPTEYYGQLNHTITNYIDTLNEEVYAALLSGEVIGPSLPLYWGTNEPPENHDNGKIVNEFIIPLLYDNKLLGLIYIKGHISEVSKSEIETLLHDLAADASFALSRFEALKGKMVAEKRAKQSEYRFIEIFMAAPIPMLIINKTTETLQRMNKAFIKWSGYTEQDALTEKNWLQCFLGDGYALLHPQHQSDSDPNHENLIDAKEISIFNKNKQQRIVLLSSLSISQDTIFSFSDITNIRQQEQALIQKEKTFRQIIEQPNIGIYVRDQTHFIYTNQKFCDIVGYTSDELKHKTLADLIINDPTTEAIIKEIWQTAYPQGTNITRDIPLERRDGKRIVLAINGTTIIEDTKNMVVAFVEDITLTDQARQQTQYYIHKLENAIKGTFLAVSNMVEVRDPYTSGHEHRVASIAKKIAEKLGLPAAHCDAIELIGLVHDIGKVAVPAEMLSKPGRLSPMELELVKGHAEAGYQILKDVEFDFPVAESIRQHHERLDGSGYPRGLKGDEILLESRIISVADVIEAMSSHRPYRAALGLNVAMEELSKGRGKLYDPTVVDTLFKIIHENNNQLPT